MWRFCCGYFLQDILTLFVATTLLIYVKFTFTKFLWMQSRWLLWYFFYKSIYIQFEIHFQHFLFLQHFHLYWPIPLFWIFVFIKCHLGLSLTRRQHNHMLLCLWINWITNVQWPITDRLWKRHDWSLIMMCVWYVHGNLWTEKPVYIITHSNIPC